MKENKIIIVSGRQYVVDMSSYTFSFAATIAEAKEKADEETQLRLLQALMVVAIGLPALIATPVWQIHELFQKVTACLTEEPIEYRKYNERN